MLGLLGVVVFASSAPPVKAPILDAVIDSSASEANGGREFYSVVGSGKALLIHDQSLALAGRKGLSVRSPKLVLTILSGEPKVSSVRLLRKPWREGSGAQMNEGADSAGATWRRASKNSPWQTPGALGAEDSTELQGWKAEVAGAKITLTGLDESMAQMAAGQARAWGYRIEFQGEGRIGSTDTPGAEPQFIREEAAPEAGAQVFVERVTPARALIQAPRKGEKVVLEASVVNRGSGGSSATTLRAWMDGVQVGEASVPALAPQAQATAPLEVTWSGAGTPLEAELVVTHEAGGASQGGIFYPLGLSVRGTSPEVIDLLNRWALPFSRFSFAPEGVAERFQLAGPAGPADIVLTSENITPAAVLAPAVIWAGGASGINIGLTPDSRDERLAILGVPSPPFGWPSRFEGEPPLPASGLLGRYEAARLHLLAGVRGEGRKDWSPPIPRTLAFRLHDLSGSPMAETPVEIYRSPKTADSKPIYKGRTLKSGSFFLAPGLLEPQTEEIFTLQDPMEASLILAVGSGEVIEEIAIPKWQLVSEAVRGPLPALTLDIRVSLPRGPIDREANLALSRPVEDSAGRFPAQLAALVDGSDATSVEVASSPDRAVWVEIDLGRDRLVGEIELVFAEGVPGGLEILHYGTAQPPSSAVTWVKDLAPALRIGPSFQRNIAYRGPSRVMRFIRVAILSGGPAKIAEVKIRPLAAQPEGSEPVPAGALPPGSGSNPPR